MKKIMIAICLGLVLLSIGVAIMDQRIRYLNEQIESMEREQRRHGDLLDGIENWMEKSLAQSCDTLPSCEEWDKEWLKGNIR